MISSQRESSSKVHKRPRLKLSFHSCSQSWLLPQNLRGEWNYREICFQYDDKQNLLSGFCLLAGLTSIKDFKMKNKNLSFLCTTFVAFCFIFPRVSCVLNLFFWRWEMFHDFFSKTCLRVMSKRASQGIYLWPNDECWQVKTNKINDYSL